MIDREKINQLMLSHDMAMVVARRQVISMAAAEFAETGRARIGYLHEPAAACLFLDEIDMLSTELMASVTGDDDDDERDPVLVARLARFSVLMSLARDPELLSYVQRTLRQTAMAEDQLEYGIEEIDLTDPEAVEEFVINGREIGND